MIDLNHIKNTLAGLKPELSEKYAVSEIGIFGSVARGDFNSESDVDIIVDFSKPIGIEFVTLADELETRLACKVDLVSRGGIRSKYYQEIESDIIYV